MLALRQASVQAATETGRFINFAAGICLTCEDAALLHQGLENSEARCVKGLSAVASCHQSFVFFFTILNNFERTVQLLVIFQR